MLPETLQSPNLDGLQINVFGSDEKVNEESVRGRALVDATHADSVKHFVQASGDRSGLWEVRSRSHQHSSFTLKFDIGTHGKWRRPVSFMNSYRLDLNDKGFAAM
jgi:hypothetical protein